MTPDIVHHGALIPDTVNGAIILSIIDFFFSFVIITFIGFVLAAFPWLSRLGQPRTEVPVVFSIIPERDVSAEHAACIAAAVYATIGFKRLVHIGEARPDRAWAVELRSRLHTSHAPRISRR